MIFLINDNDNKKKQLYWRFERLISIRENVNMAKIKWGGILREKQSLLIAVQNNAIRTNHIKARIDKTQKTADVGYVVIKAK